MALVRKAQTLRVLYGEEEKEPTFPTMNDPEIQQLVADIRSKGPATAFMEGRGDLHVSGCDLQYTYSTLFFPLQQTGEFPWIILQDMFFFKNFTEWTHLLKKSGELFVLLHKIFINPFLPKVDMSTDSDDNTAAFLLVANLMGQLPSIPYRDMPAFMESITGNDRLLQEGGARSSSKAGFFDIKGGPHYVQRGGAWNEGETTNETVRAEIIAEIRRRLSAHRPPLTEEQIRGTCDRANTAAGAAEMRASMLADDRGERASGGAGASSSSHATASASSRTATAPPPLNRRAAREAARAARVESHADSAEVFASSFDELTDEGRLLSGESIVNALNDFEVKLDEDIDTMKRLKITVDNIDTILSSPAFRSLSPVSKKYLTKVITHLQQIKSDFLQLNSTASQTTFTAVKRTETCAGILCNTVFAVGTGAASIGSVFMGAAAAYPNANPSGYPDWTAESWVPFSSARELYYEQYKAAASIESLEVKAKGFSAGLITRGTIGGILVCGGSLLAAGSMAASRWFDDSPKKANFNAEVVKLRRKIKTQMNELLGRNYQLCVAALYEKLKTLVDLSTLIATEGLGSKTEFNIRAGFGKNMLRKGVNIRAEGTLEEGFQQIALKEIATMLRTPDFNSAMDKVWAGEEIGKLMRSNTASITKAIGDSIAAIEKNSADTATKFRQTATTSAAALMTTISTAATDAKTFLSDAYTKTAAKIEENRGHITAAGFTVGGALADVVMMANGLPPVASKALGALAGATGSAAGKTGAEGISASSASYVTSREQQIKDAETRARQRETNLAATERQRVANATAIEKQRVSSEESADRLAALRRRELAEEELRALEAERKLAALRAAPLPAYVAPTGPPGAYGGAPPSYGSQLATGFSAAPSGFSAAPSGFSAPSTGLPPPYIAPPNATATGGPGRGGRRHKTAHRSSRPTKKTTRKAKRSNKTHHRPIPIPA